ncbi:MAG: arsenosugar biosynthesis radical SAM (seleno)protein ArsS [bacterium]
MTLLTPVRTRASQLELLTRALDAKGSGGSFEEHLEGAGLMPLRASGLDVMQINLGRLCNQTCAHCHVDAGPTRSEIMTRETAELCIAALAKSEIGTVDLTGGAPEMCPSFEYLVREARRLGRHVIDRSNLTILTVPRHADLAQFLAEHEVEVAASLPHYRQRSTDKQRGEGVFERSLAGLRLLNAAGYGCGDPARRLALVTNPVGAFLPSGQASLEQEWKRELRRLHGIEFDALYTITNMPIARYADWLHGGGHLEDYMQALRAAFNPKAAAKVMCRNMLSVDWRGQLFDCDFNQMLGLELIAGAPRHISDLDPASACQRRIVTGPHCFGCSAGSGSSCGGTTA